MSAFGGKADIAPARKMSLMAKVDMAKRCLSKAACPARTSM